MIRLRLLGGAKNLCNHLSGFQVDRAAAHSALSIR
jgi:hypothetical protein